VLLHDGEVLDMPVPREPHDVPVAAAATPSALHRFEYRSNRRISG
jgi:5-formyltetrahydrofolate cyclo-ligase